jgi:uncharacterized membrane protein YidH (DUF202 family)
MHEGRDAGYCKFPATQKELAMYIGLGLVVLIVIVVLVFMFLRRA